MTPLEIQIILHYYYSAEDFRGGDFSAPAVRGAIDRFAGGSGLLRLAVVCAGQIYEITERGTVYVEALKEMPLPVQVWTMPARTKENGAT